MRKSSIAKHLVGGDGSPLAVAIGHEIRRRRQGLGLTQELVGSPLTRAFVSSVEHGRTVPSIPALALIADRLAVPLDEFFRGVNKEMTGAYTAGHGRRPDPPPRRRR